MKTFTLLIFLVALLSIDCPVFCQESSFQWAFECGNPPNSTDTKTILTSDIQDNIIQAGEFLDTAVFKDKSVISAGGTDVFIVKYIAGSDVLWANQIGGVDYDYIQKIATDQEGNIILVGFFYGTTQIGTDSYTSFGSQDIYIAKFSPDGDYLW